MAEKEKQTEQEQQVEVGSVDKLASRLDTEQKSAMAEFIGKVLHLAVYERIDNLKQ